MPPTGAAIGIEEVNGDIWMSDRDVVAKTVGSDIGSIHVLDRPFRQLEAQLVAAGRELQGGLLLGNLKGRVAVVERVLPCRNSAPEVERSLRYELDGRVIPNLLP